ncbi:hypothetical protein RUND412_010595 [Rhizina undulata]
MDSSQKHRPFSTLHSPNQIQPSEYSLHTPIQANPDDSTASLHTPITPRYDSELAPLTHGYMQMERSVDFSSRDIPLQPLNYDISSQYPPSNPPTQPLPSIPPSEVSGFSSSPPPPPPLSISVPPSETSGFFSSPPPPPSVSIPPSETSGFFSSPLPPVSPPPPFASPLPPPTSNYGSPPASPSFSPLPTERFTARPTSTTPVPATTDNLTATAVVSGRPMVPLPIYTTGYVPSNGPQSPKTPVYMPGSVSGPNGGVHAPGQIGHPNQQMGIEDYHHGLCDCFSDIPTCCLGFWCPCVLYSRTYHRLKTVPNSNINEFKMINAHSLAFCALAPVSWVFTVFQRTRIREKYRLEGSLGSDCTKAYCCVMCTLVQDDREVRDREDELRRFAGPGSGAVGDAGYKRTEGMVYGRT